MKKGTIIVDFDQTCVDSSKPVVEMYQKETSDYSKSYDLYKDELDWNFNPIINHNLFVNTYFSYYYLTLYFIYCLVLYL